MERRGLQEVCGKKDDNQLQELNHALRPSSWMQIELKNILQQSAQNEEKYRSRNTIFGKEQEEKKRETEREVQPRLGGSQEELEVERCLL